MEFKSFFFALILVSFFASCSKEVNLLEPDNVVSDNNNDSNNDDSTDSLSVIDFSNWKLILPVDANDDGKRDIYMPANLIDGAYKTNLEIQPYMYDSELDSSIEFYTLPKPSEFNSDAYPRTELRELKNPSNQNDNWSLQDGGKISTKMQMTAISEDSDSQKQYHKSILMQIRGIISEEDMVTHEFSSNYAPTLIKIRWIDGDLWVYKKSLVDESTSGIDLFGSNSETWIDASTLLGSVGFEPFTLSITALEGRLEVKLNSNELLVYEDVSLAKWPFDNYFKVGNSLNSSKENAFSKVKIYELDVTH